MRKYLAFFRLRFSMGLQYRAAAVAGIVTQFFWGAMELLAFRAFYQADPGAFPMSFQATASYVWMQQAFLALFAAWMFENEIFQCIRDGSVAYELCRPVDLYGMWFARSAANRVSRAVLRCAPILLVAAFLPAPFGMTAPQSLSAFLWWAVTMVLGLGVTVGFGMLIYLTTFFTLSPDGVRMVAVSLVEILQGAIIPLPFFPDGLRQVLELLPFAAMQNVPLRAWSGDLSGQDLYAAAGLQLFWAIVLVGSGWLLAQKALKKTVVQGG